MFYMDHIEHVLYGTYRHVARGAHTHPVLFINHCKKSILQVIFYSNWTVRSFYQILQNTHVFKTFRWQTYLQFLNFALRGSCLLGHSFLLPLPLISIIFVLLLSHTPFPFSFQNTLFFSKHTKTIGKSILLKNFLVHQVCPLPQMCTNTVRKTQLLLHISD